MTLAQDDLRSEVLRRSTEGECLTLSAKVDFWKAEVSDADVTFGVQEHILRLQIPVENASRMKVTECLNKLRCVNSHTLLWESVLRSQVSEELTAVEEVDDQIQFCLCLERIIKLYDVWTLDLLENWALG